MKQKKLFGKYKFQFIIANKGLDESGLGILLRGISRKNSRLNVCESKMKFQKVESSDENLYEQNKCDNGQIIKD